MLLSFVGNATAGADGASLVPRCGAGSKMGTLREVQQLGGLVRRGDGVVF